MQLAAAALNLDIMQLLPLLLRHSQPELRAAAVFALSCLVQVLPGPLICLSLQPALSLVPCCRSGSVLLAS